MDFRVSGGVGFWFMGVLRGGDATWIKVPTRPSSGLFSDRRYADEPVFPGLAMIGMVESEVERAGRLERERRYYAGSAQLDGESFARAVRGHWGIENRLHWVLDVVFRDDQARLRTGHGPANMAVVKHMAVNLLGRARVNTSLKNRRKLAGWNLAFLETLIRQTA